MVHVLKLRAHLRRIEELSRGLSLDSGRAWGCVLPFLGLKFLGFVDRSPFNSLVVSVLWNEGRFCADFENLFCRSLCVLAGLYEGNFPGFCPSKSLEDLCGLIFCKILSEIVEIRNGKPHCWTCCHFKLFSPLYAGCSVRRVTAFGFEGQKVGANFPDFECIWACKIRLWAPIVQWQYLMTCLLFFLLFCLVSQKFSIYSHRRMHWVVQTTSLVGSIIL